ncbi:MAG: magnesium/cobalt transporter CorA [Planctomycetota bacterium]
MISIFAWHRNAHCVETFPVETLADAKLREDPDRVLWIDLIDPTPEEEAQVLQNFMPIHALSFEDATRLRREPNGSPHLPKVEEFPDYLFVIVNPLRKRYLDLIGRDEDRHVEIEHPFTQLSAVLTRNLLVTHHTEANPCVSHLQAYLGRHPAQGDRGPDYLFHLVLDAIVDQFAPVLDHIDDALETLETRVIQAPDNRLFHTILRTKREIIVLRKTLVYEREVLVRLARGEFDLVDERETVYYRNVYDHLVRFTELIESSREMASDLLQSHLASTSNRLSQVMKVLTTISTIILPMSLISGIYGMNFKNMPELEWEYGYFIALGMMLTVGLTAVGFFWWKKWL